ncbi:MAG: DUF3488 and transglutaminase-like domain-containing protein [Gammaproteobacteria bacterium]|nr:DUF3488 and transglutaminase-like domain-containing protein [Gammaproteobacteria bacterium]
MFIKGFPQDKQITYAGMLWLLAAQLSVMSPLAFYLPVWLIPVLLISAAWRIRVMKGRTEQPGIVVIGALGFCGIAGLLASGIALVSLDMMASLLMLGFAYKAIEVIQRRDGIVVVLTGYLLVGVLFLYSQSILTAMYGVFAMTMLSGALIAIQQSAQQSIGSNLKLSAIMLLLCLPLMLVLFVFAPRFAPLWTLPLHSNHARTGISDQMTPGDIANLSQSEGLAFSVKFNRARPDQNQLYWRGMVLNYFDGNTWSQFQEELDPDVEKKTLQTSFSNIADRLDKRGEGIEYDIIYEASGQSWLFALAPVVSLQGEALYGRNFNIIAKHDVREPMMLKLISYPDSRRDVALADMLHQQALQLPPDGNAASRELAVRLFKTSSSPQDFIDSILNRYRQDAFYYTLRPPLLDPQHSIDDFLLNSKKGFCAHYAGSFVFLMRAAGIPARVVIGYQGGEWNNNGEFLAVHHYDAHAWAEVLLKNRGWVRIDPTSMVAPQRVEQNLQAAVQEEGSFLEAKIFSMTRNQWLNGVRKQLDSVQYRWRRYVLGYDTRQQAAFLKRLLGEVSVGHIAIVVGTLFTVIILIWGIVLGLFRKQPREAIEHRLYRRFCQILQKKGIKRLPSQTPQQFCRIATAQLPAFNQDITKFTETYSTLCYQPDRVSYQQQIDIMKRLLSKIRKQR